MLSLQRKGNLKTEIQTEEDSHVKTEVEMAVAVTKRMPRILGNIETKKRKGRIFLPSCQRKHGPTISSISFIL